MSGIGSVEYAQNTPGVSQIVTTSNGEKLNIPMMLGSKTNVEALDDGTYKVTTLSSYLNAKPEVQILSEDELVAKYGDDVGKNFHTFA